MYKFRPPLVHVVSIRAMPGIDSCLHAWTSPLCIWNSLPAEWRVVYIDVYLAGPKVYLITATLHSANYADQAQRAFLSYMHAHTFNHACGKISRAEILQLDSNLQ